jgi:hypothetical protein
MKKQTHQEKTKALSTSVSAFITSPKTLYYATAAVILLVLAIYLLRLDRVVGLYGDDAWYVLLAKALATGQGYTLINSPSPNIMPLYPPGFSFLLSLVWRLAPQFPQNIWLLKAVSIVAMFGVGAVVYYYFVREYEQPKLVALGIAFVTVSSPAFAFLATSTVMSECVFTLMLLLGIVAIERSVRAAQNQELPRNVLLWAAAGAACTAFAFLIRSIALGLIVAVILYLLKHRLPKAVALFIAVLILLVGPWTIYARLHAPTAEQQAEQNSYIVQSYSQNFWQRKASYSPEGYITLDELPTRIAYNAYHLLEYDFGALLAYPLYRAIEPSEGRLRYWWHDYTSLLLSALIIGGFVLTVRRRLTLAELTIPFLLLITILWPFRPFRFVLPLLPWAVFYLLEAVRAISGWLNRRHKKQTDNGRWHVALEALVLLSVINLWSNASYIVSLHGAPEKRPQWVRMFDENEKLMDWLKGKVPPDAVIAGQNPALVNLYTGLKGVGSTEPSRNWERWKQLKVRYFVLTSYFVYSEFPPAEKRFKEVYRTPVAKMRVLDFGDPATRPDWTE